MSSPRSTLVHGLPAEHGEASRRALWKLVLGVERVDAGEYLRLLQRGPSSQCAAIEKDINRALAGDAEAATLRHARTRVLNAFVHWAEEARGVGGVTPPLHHARAPYKQGMGGAAAVLLHVLPELDAFTAFRRLVTSWCPGLFGYGRGGEGVPTGCALTHDVLAVVDGQLHAHLTSTCPAGGGAYADLMFYSRVASLYATRGPLSCAARLWDVILGMGVGALPLLAVAECVLRREELRRAGRDAITRFQNIGSAAGGAGAGDTGHSGGAGPPPPWSWTRLVLIAVETQCAVAIHIAVRLRTDAALAGLVDRLDLYAAQMVEDEPGARVDTLTTGVVQGSTQPWRPAVEHHHCVVQGSTQPPAPLLLARPHRIVRSHTDHEVDLLSAAAERGASPGGGSSGSGEGVGGRTVEGTDHRTASHARPRGESGVRGRSVPTACAPPPPPLASRPTTGTTSTSRLPPRHATRKGGSTSSNDTPDARAGSSAGGTPRASPPGSFARRMEYHRALEAAGGGAAGLGLYETVMGGGGGGGAPPPVGGRAKREARDSSAPPVPRLGSASLAQREAERRT